MGLAQGFDLKPYAMRSLKNLIRERGDEERKMEELEKGLKGEKEKIEMFKRELPLTGQILSDVVEGFRAEMERRRGEKLREFMPVKSGLEEDSAAEKQKEKSFDNKINWMSSAQLWIDHRASNSNTANQQNFPQEREEQGRKRPLEVPFKPFSTQFELGINSKREKQQPQNQQQEETEQRVDKLSIGLPEFALVPPPPPPPPAGHEAAYTEIAGGQRKARRCWSPELHRQFVAALNKLGGAQVATPKQIRELMKVDGLTNDEVKSHLQKYRLHNRRGGNANATRPVGLFWGTSSENGGSSQLSISQSVSPQDLHQFSNGTVSTDQEEDIRSESYNWK
ncbi:hypothetical protein LUZ60_010176 [Juncus effusus]|nr:hypothetical protein LUZ60_010176 [Juncus effusus]